MLTDHLDLSGAHVTRLSWLPAFADALARTSRLHASVMVANQDLRHPAVLARDVTTLDRLSGGRVELGLGAGHVEQEYAWAGIDFDPVGARVGRLAEYAAVVRGLTTAGPETFSFEGKHFTIADMPVAPLPTRGRLPIMIGGGKPRVLSIAATHADIVNLNNIRDDGSADEVLAEKVGWVAAAAGDADGRDRAGHVGARRRVRVSSRSSRAVARPLRPAARVPDVGRRTRRIRTHAGGDDGGDRRAAARVARASRHHLLRRACRCCRRDGAGAGRAALTGRQSASGSDGSSTS